MVLEFELTAEDIIAFNMHHLGNMQGYVQTERRNKMMIAIIILAAAIYTVTAKGIPYSHIIALVLVAFGLILLAGYSSYMKRSIARRIRKEIDQQKSKGIIGFRRIETDKYQISESGSGGDSKCLWTAVRAIEKNERLIMVYISPVSAYIIPFRAFKSEKEFDDFYTRISETRNALI